MSLFGWQRPLHQILGGGKAADVLMWRDKRLSATILIGGTLIWFLFEVVEYNLLTLLCHISITAMLVVFIWSNTAALMDGGSIYSRLADRVKGKAEVYGSAGSPGKERGVFKNPLWRGLVLGEELRDGFDGF